MSDDEFLKGTIWKFTGTTVVLFTIVRQTSAPMGEKKGQFLTTVIQHYMQIPYLCTSTTKQ